MINYILLILFILIHIIILIGSLILTFHNCGKIPDPLENNSEKTISSDGNDNRFTGDHAQEDIYDDELW